MALDPITEITWGNAQNNVDTTEAQRRALAIEEFNGMVEATIARRSVVEGFIPIRTVTGTDTISTHAVGGSQLQKVVPGEALPGISSDFSKKTLTIDTLVAAREFFPVLQDLFTNTDRKREVAEEQGKEIAKFRDAAFLIQAIKAARATESAYAAGSAGKPRGHFGGNQQVLAAAADALDPDKLYLALTELFVKFRFKDVDPALDDVMVVVRPDVYNTLAHAEHLINMNYSTSTGRVLQDQAILKAVGCPVYSSNNLPNGVITGHMLSTATNQNAYDGDFTKVVAAAFSPRALLAGETIPVTSDIWYSKMYKSHVVDSHLAFGVTTNRHEYAGVIELP